MSYELLVVTFGGSVMLNMDANKGANTSSRLSQYVLHPHRPVFHTLQ